jgi:succinate dehydrogenase / fumarate reductase iron-sulfur subunit
MTLLDALLQAKQSEDPSLAIRYSCREALCGSCGVQVNGIPRLACYTQVSELEGHVISLEPLSGLPLIRDLVVDNAPFFTHHRNVWPNLRREDDAEQESPTDQYRQHDSERNRYIQFAGCIKCGLCYSACPTASTDRLFPGPQALTQAYRYNADSRDRAEERRLTLVDVSHGVWRCHFAGSCTSVCPKGVDPALAIQLLRRKTITKPA